MPTSVDVCIFMRVCPDFVFGIPRQVEYFSKQVYGNFSWFYTINHNGFSDEANQTISTTLYGDGMDNNPISQWGFGEIFQSVRPFLQKFSPLVYVPANITPAGGTPLGTTLIFPHFMCPAISSIGTQKNVWTNYTAADNTYVPFNWFGHYAAMFVGVRGSSRIKIFTPKESTANVGTSTGLGKMVQVYSCDGKEAIEASGFPNFGITSNTVRGPCTSLGFACLGYVDQGGYEVTLPYYSAQKFWPPHLIPNITTSGSGNDCGQAKFINVNFSNSDGGLIMQAGGPDISVVRFRRVPGLTLGPYAGD